MRSYVRLLNKIFMLEKRNELLFFSLTQFFCNFGFAEVTFTRQKNKNKFFFVLRSFIRNFAA